MRKQFSKSDIKTFLEKIPYAKQFIDKKTMVVQEDEKLIINNEVMFLLIDNQWIPSLKLLLQNPKLLPQVVVDKGAIRFVVNGADIMRPGIVSVEQFSANSIVVIVDETVFKPIAVGKCSLSSDDLLAQTGGKHIKNLHYIGDDYWKNE
jgi:PUA-domain protein